MVMAHTRNIGGLEQGGDGLEETAMEYIWEESLKD